MDLSAYQGQSIEFQFLVAPACPAGTGCANLADSALLIDGVSGASFTPVPEPSLMLPLILLGAILTGVRLARMTAVSRGRG